MRYKVCNVNVLWLNDLNALLCLQEWLIKHTAEMSMKLGDTLKRSEGVVVCVCQRLIEEKKWKLKIRDRN